MLEHLRGYPLAPVCLGNSQGERGRFANAPHLATDGSQDADWLGVVLGQNHQAIAAAVQPRYAFGLVIGRLHELVRLPKHVLRFREELTPQLDERDGIFFNRATNHKWLIC